MYHGRERRSEEIVLLQQRDPLSQSRKPYFCLEVVRAYGTKKSPLKAERRE